MGDTTKPVRCTTVSSTGDPAVIARCQNTADIADAVNFGRDLGVEISVRGGGHNVAGLAVSDGGLMIDLRR